VRVAPLRTAHRAEQHGIAGLAGSDRRIGQGVARFIDSDTPDQRLGELEGVTVTFSNPAQNLDAFGHDLRPNAIAAEQRNSCVHNDPFTE
jgi:hypothetical protein